MAAAGVNVILFCRNTVSINGHFILLPLRNASTKNPEYSRTYNYFRLALTMA